MGFNVEGKWCIERAANDDLQLLEAKFITKPVQQLTTYSTMAFFSIPITADLSTVKELVDDVLKSPELELMKDDPTHFPTFNHGRSDWVEYSMTKSMPFGMPYEKYDSNRVKTKRQGVVCVPSCRPRRHKIVLSARNDKRKEPVERRVWQSGMHSANDTDQRERRRCRTRNQKSVLYQDDPKTRFSTTQHGASQHRPTTVSAIDNRNATAPSG